MYILSDRGHAMAPICVSVCLCPQGLGDEYQEEGKLLGEYVYQEDGDSLQTFPVMVTKTNTCTTTHRMDESLHTPTHP